MSDGCEQHYNPESLNSSALALLLGLDTAVAGSNVFEFPLDATISVLVVGWLAKMPGTRYLV